MGQVGLQIGPVDARISTIIGIALVGGTSIKAPDTACRIRKPDRRLIRRKLHS